MTYLIDTHCHLSGLSYKNPACDSPEKIIARAMRCGVSHFLCVSCTVEDFKTAEKTAAPFDNVYLAAAVHPLNLDEAGEWQDGDLKACFKNPRVIALGETGLDYHYTPETRKAQLDSLARQIAIAREVKKPLIIHAREAHKDTVALLKSENARDTGGVIHCFTDSVDMARECLDLGFYISFTGVVTFRASDNVRDAARYVPADRMMVETDCPYLSPVPLRGTENEPAFVRHTLNYLAAFKGLSQDAFAALTSKNFEELYKVKLSDPKLPDCGVSPWKLDGIIDTAFKTQI